MKHNKGFTIIESVIILVVVLILVGIALPKYFELQNRDKLSTAENFANSLAAASAVNFAECKHGNMDNCKKIASCKDLATLLPNQLPDGMTVTLKSGTPFPTISGSIVECQVNYGSVPVNLKAIVTP